MPGTPLLRIERLSDRHDREAFSSGVEPLDRYLRVQVGQDIRRSVAVCFVLVEGESPVPCGYYTLAATGVSLEDLPETLAAARRSRCDGRDNQDERAAPVVDRSEGVARP